MRIGEVLKLTPNDIEDRKLTLRAPKSGKEREIVFIPQKIADRLKEYVTRKGIGPDQRIFPISYTADREVVNKAACLLTLKWRQGRGWMHCSDEIQGRGKGGFSEECGWWWRDTAIVRERLQNILGFTIRR